MIRKIFKMLADARDFQQKIGCLKGVLEGKKKKTYRVRLTEDQMDLMVACYSVGITNIKQLESATGLNVNIYDNTEKK